MDLEKLIKYLQIIIPCFIYVGFMDLYLFYNHWDINIIDYLEPTEIIFSFLDNINILLMLVLSIFLGSYYVKGVEYVSVNTIEPLEKKLNLDRFRFIPQNIATIIILLIVGSGVLFVANSLIESYKNNYWDSIVLMVVIFFSVFISGNSNFNRFIEDKEKKYFFWKIGILIIIFLIISDYNIKQVKPNAVKFRFLFYCDKDTIGTSDTKYFLGKTRNYYFLYDEEIKKSTVIRADKVFKVEKTNSRSVAPSD